MLGLHLDENVDHVVAQGLRLRGMDVTTTTDANLIGATDDQQLSFVRETASSKQEQFGE